MTGTARHHDSHDADIGIPLPTDAAEYDLEDAAGTVRSAPRRWRWIVEGLVEVPGAALVALEALGEVLAAAGGDGVDLAGLAQGVEQQLRELAERLGPRTKLVDALGANHPLLIATEEVDRLLSGAGRAVSAEVGVPGSGRLVRIGVSGGGVPKRSVPVAALAARGVQGDVQAVRRHHGRPFQAVSLFSEEVIAELSAEGHPISPGSAGENLTVSGIDWCSLRPGIRLATGGPEPVVLELTSWAPPCATVAGSFADHSFDHLDHDLHPGRGRAFAWVVQAGRVATGDEMIVVP